MKKLAVITGGSAGIGKCIAQHFMQDGYAVAVIDKNEIDYTCDFFYKGDIANEDVLTDFANKVKEKFSSVYCLINNACLSKQGLFACSYDDFLYVQKIGVASPYYLTKLFMDSFDTGANIINISSTRAFQSQANTESYSSAKGGITALTHAMAVSLSGKVRVNSISPGWIDTTDSTFSGADNTQHLSGRVGKPHDIANMCLFLSSDKASFITGENINIDGGMSKLMIYHDDHGWNYEDN